MATWDVIVIGLGGVGSAAIAHLAKRGLRVLGLDQYAPVHDEGSSHGMTRIIRQAYFEHPCYVPLLRRAYELWDQLEQETGQHLFHRTGLVEMGPADGVVIPGVRRSANAYGLEIEELSTRDVMRRWPGLGGQEDWHAVIEVNAGYLKVEDCVAAHLELASRASAVRQHETQVQHWEVDGDGVRVTTRTGIERAARLVIAAGPWSRKVLGEFGIPLRILRKHQYWYRPQSDGYAEAEGFPCFFHETKEGFFYGFPNTAESAGVKVARHDGGTPLSEPQSSHPPDPQDQSRVESYLRECLPNIGTHLESQAGCYYTVTPDEHFVADLHPDHKQVAVIAGLSGHGFKFASVLGELASQLVTEGATSLDTSLLTAQR